MPDHEGAAVTGAITVDARRCIGSGNCEVRAPHTFAVDDDGVARVTDSQADSWESVTAAAAECPVQAITLLAARDRPRHA